MLEWIIATFAPFSCLYCGDEGQYICNYCLVRACPAVPSRCYSCRTATENFRTCRRCRSRSGLYSVYVCTDYSDCAKRLIQAFKFERVQSLAAQLGFRMSTTLPELIENTSIIPVPTATSHIRQRGYDHASLLARKISKHSKHEILFAVLKLNQVRQVGAKRQTRVKQLKNGFGLTRGDFYGKDVVLVDDVLTTGATLEEIAKLLKSAGARRISAVVFAQT